jgi:5-oxoprolinase (ATP-hydrolysing)
MDKAWKISVDTGGTFTDCIAQSPSGETEFIKVLSSGRIGGKIVERISERSFRVDLKGIIEKDLFRGYWYIFPGIKWQSRIITNDSLGNLELEDTPPKEFSEKDSLVYITAYEEAPLLTARLATRTPLNAKLPLIHF